MYDFVLVEKINGITNLCIEVADGGDYDNPE